MTRPPLFIFPDVSYLLLRKGKKYEKLGLILRFFYSFLHIASKLFRVRLDPVGVVRNPGEGRGVSSFAADGNSEGSQTDLISGLGVHEGTAAVTL